MIIYLLRKIDGYVTSIVIYIQCVIRLKHTLLHANNIKFNIIIGYIVDKQIVVSHCIPNYNVVKLSIPTIQPLYHNNQKLCQAK